MPLEDDDDRATFFDVDAFGEAATFTSSAGITVACTVVVNSPREIAALGMSGVARFNRTLMVQKSDVAAPDGGSFTGIVSLGVTAVFKSVDASLDDTGKIWTIPLKPTT